MGRFLSALTLFSLLSTGANVCATDLSLDETQPSLTANAFSPFTGKVTSNRVRMRLQPSLESPVIRDLNRGDMVIVTGEEADNFVAVEAPAATEAYVFRTFVLDGVIEGSHVNVRLAPDLTSPVIAQLNTGDRVDGVICAENPKWLKLTPPDSVRFYVAADYLENAGGPELLAQLEERKNQVNMLLSYAKNSCDEELSRPFQNMDFDRVAQAFEMVIEEFTDFPQHVEEAETHLAQAKEHFLNKKIAFLENRAEQASSSWTQISDEMSGDFSDYARQLDELEMQIARELNQDYSAPYDTPTTVGTELVRSYESQPIQPAATLSTDPLAERSYTRFESQEAELYARWSMRNDEGDVEDFYQDEALSSAALSGVLQRYEKAVHNKPGEFILVDPSSHRTLAYIYSTRVDLQKNLGREVTLQATQRPNHNFAFPAYFALSVE